mgnify:CR=1 FL=1
MNGKRVLKTNRKASVALVAILVLLCCAVAGTVAFLVTKTDSVVNTFTPSKVTTYVEEEFNGQTKSNVKIQNTGNIDAYIRAAVIVNWVNDAGEIYGTAPVASTEDAPGDYTISYDETDWFKGSDGYWYYTKPVAPSTENNPQYTGVLIESCAPAGQAPAGYALQVTILADGIQSVPADAVQQAWGVDPSTWATTNG